MTEAKKTDTEAKTVTNDAAANAKASDSTSAAKDASTSTAAPAVKQASNSETDATANNTLANSAVTTGSAEASEATKQIEAGKEAAEAASKALDEKVADGKEITYRVIKIGNVMSVNPNAEVIAEGLSFQEANEKIVGQRNMFVEAEV